MSKDAKRLNNKGEPEQLYSLEGKWYKTDQIEITYMGR